MDPDDIVQRALAADDISRCAFSDAVTGERPDYSLVHAIAEVLSLTEEDEFVECSNFLMCSPFGWTALDSLEDFVACVNAFSYQRTVPSVPVGTFNMSVMRAATKCHLSRPTATGQRSQLAAHPVCAFVQVACASAARSQECARIHGGQQP